MEVKPKYLGEHYVLELFDCDPKMLDNIPQIEEFMLEAARLANATVVSKSFHQFSPYGISGTIVITESHFNIHTWPEHGFAAIDLFTCGDSLDPLKAKDYLIKALSCRNHEFTSFKRGILNKE